MCSEKPLSGKTAVVTGAYQGIGKEIALALANAGANIAAIDVVDALEETVNEIRALGVEASGYKGDVANLDEMGELMGQIAKQFGSLDILVNNAGITRDNLLIRMREDEWDKVLAINLKGVFNCAKAAGRVMLKQKSGKIVNIASVVGINGNVGQANYSASKGGVIALTKTAAKEFASRGVNVNAVAPGFIATRMTEELSDEAKAAALAQVPLNKMGGPVDVAKAVLFLAGPDSDYVTGHVLNVDGGMAM